MLACLLVLVASCSSSNGSTTVPSTTPAPTYTEADRATTTSTSATGGGDAAAYREALSAGLSGSKIASGDFVFSDAQAACVAQKWTSIVGVDAFVAAEVAPADLEDPDFDFPILGLDAERGGEMVDAVTDCGVDVYEQTLLIFSQNLDAKQGACLRREFGQDLARQYLIEVLIQTDLSADLDTTLTQIDTTCRLSAA